MQLHRIKCRLLALLCTLQERIKATCLISISAGGKAKFYLYNSLYSVQVCKCHRGVFLLYLTGNIWYHEVEIQTRL